MNFQDFKRKWDDIPQEIGIMQLVTMDSKLWFSRDFKSRKTLTYSSEVLPHFENRSEAFEILIADLNGKWQISIFLKNEKEKDVFIYFLWDLYESVMNLHDDEQINLRLRKRVIEWSKLFEFRKNYLSLESLVGLFGELYFIKDKLFEIYGVEESIRGWRGPLGEDQDFVFNQNWFEVKTIRFGKEKVNISSIEQLDRTDIGSLIVFEVEKSNYSVENTIGIRSLINDILYSISDNLSVLYEFERKLILLGYKDDEYYNDSIYLVKRARDYTVTNTFPRIRRESIDVEILNTNYTLSLSGIERFRGDIYATAYSV